MKPIYIKSCDIEIDTISNSFYFVFNTFRKYSHKDVEEKARHTSTANRGYDPCASCWRSPNWSSVNPQTTSSSFILWGAFRYNRRRTYDSDEIDLGSQYRGGIGAFYYYTLNSALTTLRLRLKTASEVRAEDYSS